MHRRRANRKRLPLSYPPRPQLPPTLPPSTPVPGIELQSLLTAAEFINKLATHHATLTPRESNQLSPHQEPTGLSTPPRPKSRWPRFMQNAPIPNFDPNLVPDVRVRIYYNDDLYLGSFQKSNKIWGGAQKKGAIPGVIGKPSYYEHVTQALTTEFCLTKEIPIPTAIINSAEWISSTPREEILRFWETQYSDLHY